MSKIIGKYCPMCKTFKKASDFYKNIGRKDGLTSYCKVCHLKCTHEYRAENIDKIRKKDRIRKKKCKKEKK